MKTRLNYLILSALYLFIMACGVKVDLPTETSAYDPIFGAGDTSYIRISPDWDAANGYSFSSPWDILVGADGYLFVADHDQSGIRVISAAGQQVVNDAYGNKFASLSNLVDEAGTAVHPFAIDQDSRLNLFIADSSNRLLVWNQYLNNVGVDSIASRIAFRGTDADSIWVSNMDSLGLMLDEGWRIGTVEWMAGDLDAWLTPRTFWDASDSLEAIRITRYFLDPVNLHVTGVSSRGDQCLVADANANAIIALDYVPVALLKTGAGDPVLVHKGRIASRAVSPGTGNGTVNEPKGMTHGKDGALYYTQWGENFSVHKVGGSSGFEYGEDDIMEIDRYDHVSDVALDPIGNIYVADTGNDRIQQFNASGRFTFNIGMSKVLVDSTYLDSFQVGGSYQVVNRDTSFQVEVADILDGPRSVAVDGNGVVYIADTGNQRVMRYRLSTELDYGTGEQ